MEPNWTEAHIRAAFSRMVAYIRANPEAVMTNEDADALPAAERAERDADHLLSYLRGGDDGLALDGEPAVSRWLEDGRSAPDLVVTVERTGESYSAFAHAPGEEAGYGLGNGDLDGTIAFVRERFAALAA